MSWPADAVEAHYRRLRGPVPDLTKDEPVDYQARLKEAWPPGKPEKPEPKARKPSRKLEERVQRQIVDLLEAHGWLILRTNKFCGIGFSSQGAIEPGMPDLMARKRVIVGAITGPETPWDICWDIRWIEVKRPGGKVSVLQATWHQLARARGETVLVAESVEEVAAAIGVTL